MKEKEQIKKRLMARRELEKIANIWGMDHLKLICRIQIAELEWVHE